MEPGLKKRRNNFSESLSAPLMPALPLKGKMQLAKFSKDEEVSELRLGCFEQPEPVPPRKHQLNAAAKHNSAGEAAPKTKVTAAQPAVLATQRRKEESTANAAPIVALETNSTAMQPEVPANDEDVVVQQRKQDNERREREYFKAYTGEPCGPENRFLVESLLGRGSFSSVYRCSDSKSGGKEYAVKFIRDNAVLRKATESEVRLMRRLRTKAAEKDPEGASSLLGLAGPETFVHHGHLALIFHLQRCDMRTGLRKQLQAWGCGFRLQELQVFARDIFRGLRALRSVRIIHGDLKPDNLLLSLDSRAVKVSDFGTAVDLDEPERTCYIRPAYCSNYRAPEVILGHPSSTRSDAWSAGVTLFELAAGRPLVAEETNNATLYEILKTCGAFTKSVLGTGKHVSKHFSSKGDFKRAKTDGSVHLYSMVQFAKPATPVLKRLERADINDVLLGHFADFLSSCCVVADPRGRSAPDTALQHKFLSGD